MSNRHFWINISADTICMLHQAWKHSQSEKQNCISVMESLLLNMGIPLSPYETIYCIYYRRELYCFSTNHNAFAKFTRPLPPPHLTDSLNLDLTALRRLQVTEGSTLWKLSCVTICISHMDVYHISYKTFLYKHDIILLISTAETTGTCFQLAS